MTLNFECGFDTTTAVVTADDNMFYLEYFDRVLDNREAVEVGVHHHIGNIAVHKNFAGWQVDDFIGRHSAIGTTYPQVFGCLLAGQACKKLRVSGKNVRCPGLIVIKQGF